MWIAKYKQKGYVYLGYVLAHSEAKQNLCLSPMSSVRLIRSMTDSSVKKTGIYWTFIVAIVSEMATNTRKLKTNKT